MKRAFRLWMLGWMKSVSVEISGEIIRSVRCTDIPDGWKGLGVGMKNQKTPTTAAINEAEKECARTTGDLLQTFKEGAQYSLSGSSASLTLNSSGPLYHNLKREYLQQYGDTVWQVTTEVSITTSVRCIDEGEGK